MKILYCHTNRNKKDAFTTTIELRLKLPERSISITIIIIHSLQLRVRPRRLLLLPPFRVGRRPATFSSSIGDHLQLSFRAAKHDEFIRQQRYLDGSFQLDGFVVQRKTLFVIVKVFRWENPEGIDRMGPPRLPEEGASVAVIIGRARRLSRPTLFYKIGERDLVGFPSISGLPFSDD